MEKAVCLACVLVSVLYLVFILLIGFKNLLLDIDEIFAWQKCLFEQAETKTK